MDGRPRTVQLMPKGPCHITTHGTHVKHCNFVLAFTWWVTWKVGCIQHSLCC